MMIANMTRAAINTIKDIDNTYEILSQEYDTLPVRLQKIGPSGWDPHPIINKLYFAKQLRTFSENSKILINREARDIGKVLKIQAFV